MSMPPAGSSRKGSSRPWPTFQNATLQDAARMRLRRFRLRWRDVWWGLIVIRRTGYESVYQVQADRNLCDLLRRLLLNAGGGTEGGPGRIWHGIARRPGQCVHVS